MMLEEQFERSGNVGGYLAGLAAETPEPTVSPVDLAASGQWAGPLAPEMYGLDPVLSPKQDWSWATRDDDSAIEKRYEDALDWYETTPAFESVEKATENSVPFLEEVWGYAQDKYDDFTAFNEEVQDFTFGLPGEVIGATGEIVKDAVGAVADETIGILGELIDPIISPIIDTTLLLVMVMMSGKER